MGRTHSLGGHVWQLCKAHAWSRDALPFMLSFKQSISKQPRPVCPALRASRILTFICAQGRKGHREGISLPSPQPSPTEMVAGQGKGFPPPIVTATLSCGPCPASIQETEARGAVLLGLQGFPSEPAYLHSAPRQATWQQAGDVEATWPGCRDLMGHGHWEFPASRPYLVGSLYAM